MDTNTNPVVPQSLVPPSPVPSLTPSSPTVEPSATTSASPPPIQSTPTQPKKSNKLIWLLTVLVVLIGVISTAYFYYQKNLVQPIPQIAPQATPAPNPNAGSDSADSVIPSDWKTYQSNNLGFQIKYPADWIVKDDIITSYNPGPYQGSKKVPDKIVKCDFTKQTSLSSDPNLKISLIKIINQNNPKISQLKYEYLNSAPSGNSSDLFLFEQELKSVYLMCFYFDPSFETVYDQILSTFKFLD